MNIIKEWELNFPSSSENNDFLLPTYSKTESLVVEVNGNQKVKLTSNDLPISLMSAKDFSIYEGGTYTTEPGIYYGSISGLKYFTISIDPSTISSEGTVTIRVVGD